MKKLKDNRGETLVESLASILIAALAFALLATSVVTAGKINAKTRGTDVSFQYAEETLPQDAKITIRGSGLIPEQKEGTVSLYEDNGYYYYVQQAGGEMP